MNFEQNYGFRVDPSHVLFLNINFFDSLFVIFML